MKINEIEKSNSRYIGKKVQYFETIDSTHKYAKRNIDNINNGSIIIAEAQTGGIGTKGRIWYTGKENNIAMTIVLKPDKKVEELENLTVDIAKAIQKAIQELYNIELKIKEPNDLLLKEKKICGILTEVNSIGEKINYLLISMGFNVNETEFPLELEHIVTSLKKEYNREFSREEVIIRIIRNLEEII
ncbi:MAG: biotin--[acetyl-CoA-carboxylase] ligase [Clostridia bacterium]|nr:biotin--[acetyl-CoA-carboxylase] ligase [Clostridia bacterium]